MAKRHPDALLAKIMVLEVNAWLVPGIAYNYDLLFSADTACSAETRLRCLAGEASAAGRGRGNDDQRRVPENEARTRGVSHPHKTYRTRPTYLTRQYVGLQFVE